MAIGSSFLFSNTAGVAFGFLLPEVIDAVMRSKYQPESHFIPAACAAGVIMIPWISASIKTGIVVAEVLFMPRTIMESMFGKEIFDEKVSGQDMVFATTKIGLCIAACGMAAGAASELIGIPSLFSYALAQLTSAALTYKSRNYLIRVMKGQTPELDPATGIKMQ